MVINQTPIPHPLPASAWGPDAARIHARIDESLAAADLDDENALFARVLAMETYSESRFD